MQSKQRSVRINRRGIKPFNPSKQELLEVCDKDISQATILAVLEYFIDVQVTQFMRDNGIDDVDLVEEIHFCVLMSYADLEKRGIKRRRFSLAVSKLIGRGFIDRFIEPSKPNGPYYYTLNYEAIDKAIVTAIKKGKLSASDWAPTKSHNHGEKVLLPANDLSTGFIQGPPEHRSIHGIGLNAELCTNEHKETLNHVPLYTELHAELCTNEHKGILKHVPFNTELCTNEHKGILKHVPFNTELCNFEHGDVHNYIDLCTFGHSKTAEIDAKEGVVSGTKRVTLLGAQHNVIHQDTEKPTVSLLTQLLMHENAVIFPGIIYNDIIYNGEINNTDNNNKSNPPSHYHSQPKASPSAENDSAHHPQPSASDDESVSASSSDETDGACITKHQKLATGENSSPVPTSTPSGNFLFSSEVVEKSTSPDSTQETDTPSEDPKNSWRPAASCENQLQCDVAASENKIEAEVASDSGGLKEPIGFRVDLVEVAPRAAAPDESRESVTPSAKSRRGSDQVYFNRSWIGYRDDDPDVRDQSLKDQKGKGRRPEESKKKRCPAFRATRKPMASADIWVEIIRERYDFGEYPKSVTPEIIALAEYWIRGLYKAEPRVAAELDMMDGYPQIIAKVLEVHGKTPRQFRAVSDYIRSTAGSLDFDWSCRILSPDALNQRTRTNNRVYINHILDMVERNGASGVAAGRGGQMNQPQQEATLGYEGMGRERKLQDLKARMSKAHNAGFWMYLNINRMHSNGDVRGLEDIVPQDMWHFVEEYREITGWKKEVA